MYLYTSQKFSTDNIKFVSECHCPGFFVIAYMSLLRPSGNYVLKRCNFQDVTVADIRSVYTVNRVPEKYQEFVTIRNRRL
jgi:hypothetical protein